MNGLGNKNMYTCTKNVMKSSVIEPSIGVRQGAMISCLPFPFYIDNMVKMLKNQIEINDFLGYLHTMYALNG